MWPRLSATFPDLSCRFTLATVTKRGRHLETLLQREEVDVRELARRLVKQRGGDAADYRAIENARRALGRYLTEEGEDREISDEAAAEISLALGDPSPWPPKRKRLAVTSFRHRLESVEAAVDRAGKASETANAALADRVARLEEWRASLDDEASQAPNG